ncbi:MAG: histidine phosphatase family protein [Ilumatobacteraceae bacterium]
MRIILVRHGRTALNAAGLLQGRVDEPVDPVGEAQAAAVASRLSAEVDPVAVVTSPLMRARRTGEILCATAGWAGVPVTVDERWIELDYGIYDRRPTAEVPSEVWHGWRSDPTFSPEGGESFGDLDRRVRAACDELAARPDGGDVVVVSHVSPIKAAVAWALGADPGVAHRSRLDQAAVCRIEVGRTGPVLLSFNERP